MTAPGRALALLCMAGAALSLFVAPQAGAQIEPPRPLPLPDFEPAPRQPGEILPPIPLPETPDTEGLDAGVRIFLRGVRITGNTAISDAVLDRYTEPFVHRVVSSSDLAALRDALTRVYVDAGYITSGAVLPDQSLDDGIVEIRIVESSLTSIDISTNGSYRPAFLRARLRWVIDDPVNIFQVEEQLQVLQQDARIQRVEAQLLPGARRGESRLLVTIAERPPFVLGAEYDNYESPVIGAQGGEFDATWLDVTGLGDALGASYHVTDGLDDVEATYGLPLGPWGTQLDLRMRKTWNRVVEPAYDLNELGIRSKTTTWALGLRQSLWRTPRHDLAAFLIGELRRTRSELDPGGVTIPFPTEGAEDGRTRLTLLRFGGDYVYRGAATVLAARSTVTVGLHALNATHNSGDVPDGQFVAWLGQAQAARRLPWLDSRLVGRLDVQLSSEPLLAIEQLAMGGHDSVRGYRESQVVEDQGIYGSLEWRWPVWRGAHGIPEIEIAPFVDVGHAMNRKRDTEADKTLVGVGGVLRIAFTRFLHGEVTYGKDLISVEKIGRDRLQDSGIFFGVRVDMP